MEKRRLHLKSLLALLTLTTLFWIGTPASAQTAPSQNTMSSRDSDTTRSELSQFDQFMDSHHEIGEQLHKDPSLVNNKEFVEKHPALQSYLQDHPGIREEVKENPNAFMQQENRFDRTENGSDRDTTRGELARFDQFMDSHHEIGEQLRKDPSLVNNKEFVEKHPALQSYLQDHPGVREDVKENPSAFMQQENRFDRTENGSGRDTTRGELARFDQFMDSHHEIGEQLHKDPSLVNNKEFVEKHPALQAYLQDHPGVREEVKENPSAFMQQENRFDRTEPGRNGDWRNSDATRGQLASFGEFLGGHSNISQQLSKDPSLAKNEEYVANHPELQEYLKAHPGVKEELTENPQRFVSSAQAAGNNHDNVSNNNEKAAKTPLADPKPKQLGPQ